MGGFELWQSLCIELFVDTMQKICVIKGVRYAAYVTFWLASMACLPILATPAPSVILDWDASVDPTVTGYNLYYGGASRSYTNVVPAGQAITAVVSNLTVGATYYFAATTYDLAGLESVYSTEVSYVVPVTNSVVILQANARSAQNRSLTISGAVGSNYQVQYCTNLAAGTIWYPLATYTQTNAVQTVSINPIQSNVFYRVQLK
jgi:hypothetical protein